MLGFLLFLLFFSDSEQALKVWIPDLSFNNSLNWTPRRVPCSRDRIVYPRDMMYELQLGEGRVWVAGLVLPRDGGLLLPRDGELRLGGTRPGDNCPGEEMHFTDNIIRFWEDPSNWRMQDDGGGVGGEAGLLPGEGGPAVTHVDRLPCFADSVSFPALHGLVVQLPNAMQFVKNIFMEGQRLSELAWMALINSRPLTFIQSLDGAPPPDVRPAYSSIPMCQVIPSTRTCSLVKCLPPRCLQPVKPDNHCCNICGAVIRLHKAVLDTQTMRRTREIVSSRVAETDSGVRWWVGYTLTGLQVVLVDAQDYDGASSEIAPLVKEALDSRSKELGLNLSSLLGSGLPWRGLGAARGGWEALATLGVVLCALSALLLYYYPPGGAGRAFTHFRIPSPFARNFARFDNRSREGSLVLGISQLSLDKAFDNPMYAAAARRQPEVVKEAERETDEEEYEVKEGNPEGPDTEEEDLLEETTFQE